MITRKDAVNEMFTRSRNAIQSVSPTLISYVPDIFWQGINVSAKPNYDRYFCRVSLATVLEQQITLSTECGFPGQKHFETAGILTVQMFLPISDARAWEIGGAMATIVRDAFRRNVAGDSIVYRRSRVRELDPELQCLRFNVITEYEYDELV